jgi:beta-phosphoglucomutase
VFPATLFDYNGVLVDDERVHLAAFREVLAPLGIDLDERTYWDRYLGFDDAGAFAAVLLDQGRPAPDETVVDLIERKKPVYLRMAEGNLHAFDGAAALVRRRAARGPAVVVSGALRAEIVMGLQVLGVGDLVTGIVAAEDTNRSKPDPEGYALGIAALDAIAGPGVGVRALVIEDSTAGVQAAKSAGLACAAVTHSYPESELSEAGADLVVGDLDALDEATLDALYRRLHA